MFSLRYIVAHQHGRPVGISHGELQNTSAWRVRPGSKRHLATAVYPRLKHLRTHKTIVTCVISNGKFFTSIHCFSSSDRLCKQSPVERARPLTLFLENDISDSPET